MLKFARWNPVEYRIGEETISFKLKRLRNEEAAPLMLALAETYAALEAITEDKSPTETAVIVAKFYDTLPHDRVRAAFRDYVKDVEGVEDDDGPVTTGEKLYELADGNFVVFVLTALRNSSVLSGKEGKASGSHSTSDSVPALATADGPSDAPSTGSGDGIEPSTAIEMVPAS